MGKTKSVKEIKNIITNVSKGTIVNKNIGGKNYSYFQYYSLGKTKSFYIPNEYVREVREELNYVKDIRNEKKEIELNTRNLPSLSKNAITLSGHIMCGDIPCASYVNGKLISIDENICPLLIKRTHILSMFLSSRAIDAGRTNARLLKKVLNIKETEDYLISQYSYGATITDNYWFRPLYSKLKYKDICFNNDFYSDLALNGSFNLLPKYSKHTPQLTLTGSFEKCWKKEDDVWWLYKKGNKQNIFSELFVYELSKELKIPTAIYQYSDGIIRTKNFADINNFEPMVSIAGNDDNYENVFNSLKPYSKAIKKQYLKLIWLDTIVYNVDRHNENCGLLRDKSTGKVISLAPNFDNNLALCGNGKNLNSLTCEDGLMKLFIKFINNNTEANKLFNEIEIKPINKNLLEKCFSKIQMEDKPTEVIDFILNRYEYLNKKLIQKGI